MNPHDYVRDTFTGGCRFGVPLCLGVDADGNVAIVASPLRTLAQAQQQRVMRLLDAIREGAP